MVGVLICSSVIQMANSDTTMLTEETNDKLKETLAICDLHHQRMMFAFVSIDKYFPLTELNFGTTKLQYKRIIL